MNEPPVIPRGATYAGNPCKYGHDGLRYERSGICVHCALLHAAKQKKLKKLQDIHGMKLDGTPLSDELPVGKSA